MQDFVLEDFPDDKRAVSNGEAPAISGTETMCPKGCPAGGERALFSFRQAVAWAKQQRMAEVNEWKPMFVADSAKRQHRPRGKAAMALGAV